MNFLNNVNIADAGLFVAATSNRYLNFDSANGYYCYYDSSYMQFKASGLDVYNVFTGGSNQLTVGDGQLYYSVTDSSITSSFTFKASSMTAAVAGKGSVIINSGGVKLKDDTGVGITLDSSSITATSLTGTLGYVKATATGLLIKTPTIPFTDITGYSTPTLSQVLTAGNTTTSGQSIIINGSINGTQTLLDGDSIKIKSPTISYARGFSLIHNSTAANIAGIGFYGSAQNTITYGYAGTTYNDAILKWNTTGVGIGLGSTTAPVYLLDINKGTGIGTNSPLLSVGQNNGSVRIEAGSTSTTAYIPQIRLTGVNNSAFGSLIYIQGSNNYSDAGIRIGVSNALGNGTATGNILKVQNYTTDIFTVDYQGNTLIAGRGGFGGGLVVGAATTVITPFHASATAFANVTPIMAVATGTTSGTYQEGVLIRHGNNDATAVVRETGLFIKLSGEGSTGESGKGGAITMKSSLNYANTPDMNFYILNDATPKMTIYNNGRVGISILAGTGTRLVTVDSSGLLIPITNNFLTTSTAFKTINGTTLLGSGDFGLFNRSTLGGVYNANTATDGIHTNYQWSNTPYSSIGALYTTVYNSDWITQEYNAMDDVASKWIRNRYSGTTWSDWFKVWTSADFTGTDIANWNTAYSSGNIYINDGSLNTDRTLDCAAFSINIKDAFDFNVNAIARANISGVSSVSVYSEGDVGLISDDSITVYGSNIVSLATSSQMIFENYGDYSFGFRNTEGNIINISTENCNDGIYIYLPTNGGYLATSNDLFSNTDQVITSDRTVSSNAGTYLMRFTNLSAFQVSATNVTIAASGGAPITLDCLTGIRMKNGTYSGTFYSTLSGDRTYILPNESGTLALTSQFEDGTYTPTITGSESYAPSKFSYIRVGKNVHVSGRVEVAVSGGGDHDFTIELPISTNISTDDDLIGVVSGDIRPSGFVSHQQNLIYGNTSTNEARVTFSTDEDAVIYVQFDYVTV